HTLKIGAELRDQAAVRPDPAAPSITVTLDSTFIRSCEDGERHLEVRVGNVETETGGRQVFGAVAKADTGDCLEIGGVRPQLLLAGADRWRAGISVRSRSRACHYRDQRICCDLFIRRFTRKLAVPSVIAAPTRNSARYRSA